MTRPVILIANDDGFRAPGIRTLARIARKLGRPCIVAPDQEQSATSHSLTLRRPLRVLPDSTDIWSVDGTPTDCVNLALNGGFLPCRPSVVLSGINHGANLGDDVTYSGTVAAAMEGTLHGVPSVAFSCESRDPEHEELDILGPWILHIIGLVLAKGLPDGTLLNVNFPDPRRGPVHGVRTARQGKRQYGAEVVEKTDPRNLKYYWIGGEDVKSLHIPDSDIDVVAQGFVAVTPIHLDLTDERFLTQLAAWPLTPPMDSAG